MFSPVPYLFTGFRRKALPTGHQATQLKSRIATLFLVVCLVSNSTPAAPNTIADLGSWASVGFQTSANDWAGWLKTWNEPTDLAKELSSAWRNYGVLWWQGITSQPMLFKIDEKRSTIICS